MAQNFDIFNEQDVCIVTYTIYIVSNIVKNYDQNTNVRRTKVNQLLNSFDDPDMIPCQGVHQWNEKEYFMTLFILERNATCDFLIISAHQ